MSDPTASRAAAPILLIGAGRMGGAMVQGWRRTQAFASDSFMFRDPAPGMQAQAAIAEGALDNPPDNAMAAVKTVVLAVKPQVWRLTAEPYATLLSPDAAVISVVAGVRLDTLAEVFGARRIARVMPITGVATGAGVATLMARDADAMARAHALFDPIARTVELADEALMDAATAVSGSSPAYLYAFVEALETAGERAGLPADVAKTLARATLASAAVLLQESGEDPAELRRQVTSPNGVTQAALEVLMGDGGLEPLMRRAVEAAVRRSRELGG